MKNLLVNLIKINLIIMVKNLFLTFSLLWVSTLFNAQNVTVFNNVPFYSMYHYLGAGESLPPAAYSEIPAGAIRLHAYERDIISRKLSTSEIASLGSSLTMNITLIAACDNYDRIAGVNLALVPKGLTTYTWEQTDVKRIEIGRFITPFMNKNINPTQTPYSYQIDNIAKILHDSAILSNYDAWIEFRADGYSAAANTQVAGCADRTDVFRGNLEFVSSGTVNTTPNFFMPLSYRDNLNNYNATDVPGQTTRIVNFSLNQPVDNAVLYLTTSNHGANTGGEEYARREHFVYLDDQLVYQYKPGGKSCEPFRQYNTQGNGIYGASPKSLRNWMSWNNWCPGDAIPNRLINLGNLAAGNHTIKLNVPDAVFAAQQGYFPISMYIQNVSNGEVLCSTPTNLQITSQVSNNITFGWQETGNATNWQVLFGRKGSQATANETYQNISGNPVATQGDLTAGWYYEMYVQSKCANNKESQWAGPIYSSLIVLGTQENSASKFSVYPNPTTAILNIKNISSDAVYQIHNAAGQNISKGKILNGEVNVESLNKGVYIISVKDKDETHKTKFLKK